MKPTLTMIVLLLQRVATASSAFTDRFHSEKVKVSEWPIVLVVSIDGLPADKISILNTPTLEALRAQGVYVPYMEPSFPTRTYPNHFSMVTGLYTESHGVIDNEFLDLELNKTLSGSEPESGIYNTYNRDILPLWILNEKAGEGRVSASMLWPGGCQPYGKNLDMLPTYCEEYSESAYDDTTWDTRVDTVIRWMTDDVKPANLVFFYYDEPDVAGHCYGLESSQYFDMLKKVDDQVAYLIRRLSNLKIFNKVNLIILSDHGAVTTSQQKMINLTSLFNHNLIEAQFGETPLYNFKPKPGMKNELFRQLSQYSRSNHYSVWRKEDLTRYPFYYGASRRVFDIVVLAHAGYVFEDFVNRTEERNKKYNLRGYYKRPYGEHGYSPLVTSMQATFIAHGPAFARRGSSAPIKCVDIFPLVIRILGIPAVPNNGSWERIQDILTLSMDQRYFNKESPKSGMSGNNNNRLGNTVILNLLSFFLIAVYGRAIML